MVLSHGIFPLHVVDDFIERAFMSLAFGVLAAVLATIHLSLMPGGYRRAITITLNGERHQGHVWVHDLAVATKVDEGERRHNQQLDRIKTDEMALDIGDETIEKFSSIVVNAKTVVWNGPLGVDELREFSHGSARMALALAMHPEIESIVGGGDTADFVLKWDAKKGGSFSHVSTGGGASLDLMAGKKLPGVESLLDAHGKIR